MSKASHLAVVPRCGTRGMYLSMLVCRGLCGLETSPCRWDANSVVEFLRFFGSPVQAVRAIFMAYLSIYLYDGLTWCLNKFQLKPRFRLVSSTRCV